MFVVSFSNTSKWIHDGVSTQNLEGLPNMIVYATLVGSMASPFV